MTAISRPLRSGMWPNMKQARDGYVPEQDMTRCSIRTASSKENGESGRIIGRSYTWHANCNACRKANHGTGSVECTRRDWRGEQGMTPSSLQPQPTCRDQAIPSPIAGTSAIRAPATAA